MQFEDKNVCVVKRLSLQKLLAYGGEMQHSSENVYESQPQQQQHGSSSAAANGGLQMSPATNPTTQANPQQQQQSNYLSSSPHVQQPLPASTMASSVAALQRLSASIDVTVSRSNSRASAYEDNSNKEQSEKIDGVQHQQQPLVPTVVTQSGLSAEQHPVEDHAEHHGPTYLKANCVLYTFYGGDLKTAIDDHFNRALKESSPSGQQHPQDPGSDSPSHSESSTKLQQHRGKNFILQIGELNQSLGNSSLQK